MKHGSHLDEYCSSLQFTNAVLESPGPDSLGQFTTTTIRSIERKRIPVPACSAGQSASFALRRVRRKDVRKGMVVLPAKSESNAGAQPKVHREFVAEVLILSHATTIRTKYQVSRAKRAHTSHQLY